MKEDEEEEYTPDQPEQDQEPPREGTQEDVLRSGMQKETIMQLNHRLALTHLVDVLCSTHSFGKPLIQVRVLVARYFVPQPFVEEISVSFFFFTILGISLLSQINSFSPITLLYYIYLSNYALIKCFSLRA